MFSSFSAQLGFMYNPTGFGTNKNDGLALIFQPDNRRYESKWRAKICASTKRKEATTNGRIRISTFTRQVELSQSSSALKYAL